jgi:hypothetical protein
MESPDSGLSTLVELRDHGASDIRVDLTGLTPRNRLGTVARFARILSDAELLETHAAHAPSR